MPGFLHTLPARGYSRPLAHTVLRTRWPVVQLRLVTTDHLARWKDTVSQCCHHLTDSTNTSSSQPASILPVQFSNRCPHKSVWVLMGHRNRWCLLVYWWLYLWMQFWAYWIPFFVAQSVCLLLLVSSLHIYQVHQRLTVQVVLQILPKNAVITTKQSITFTSLRCSEALLIHNTIQNRNQV